MNEKTELSPEHARVRARELAELFGNFNKSSHLFYDGRPLHIVAIEVLEWFAASPSSKSTTDLPPLPVSRYAFADPEGEGPDIPAFSADQMLSYARAALASSSIKEDGERAEPPFDREYVWATCRRCCPRKWATPKTRTSVRS